MEEYKTQTSYFIIHITPNKIEFEKEEFFGPFQTRENAISFFLNRYVGTKIEDESTKTFIKQMSIYPYDKKYQGVLKESNHCVSQGFYYGDIYYGPFKTRYDMLSCLVHKEAEHMINNMKMFKMYLFSK